jgi:hypothetical protein
MRKLASGGGGGVNNSRFRREEATISVRVPSQERKLDAAAMTDRIFNATLGKGKATRRLLVVVKVLPGSDFS